MPILGAALVFSLKILFIVQHMNIETTLTNANTITLLENNQIQLDNINSDNLSIKQFNGLNIQVR